VFEIQNPQRKGIGLSDVVMVQRVDALPGPADPADPLQFRRKRVVPELGSSLAESAQPYAYFVVYPDKSKADKPTIAVQVLVDGNEIAKQDVDAPAPDPSGAIFMLIRTRPHPGNCELRITARQGGESVERSVRYSVAKP
jgi:hypothetical protein